MRSDVVLVNGYEIHSWYEGIVAYAVYRDGVEVLHTWCLDDVVRLVGRNPYR